MKTKSLFFATGAVLLLLGLMALSLNAGSAALLLGGAILLTSGRWPEKWRKRLMPFLLLAILLLLLYLGVLGYFGYFRQPPADLQNETVIVLGCKVHGDQPSQMLRRRLDAAAAYLKENPDASCIVSGGQGFNESQTEASVMKAYLLSAGIDENRIYLEDRSANTRQNLEFSQAILQREGLSPQLVIVSDGYHQFRARLIAGKLGLNSWAVSGHTSFWLVPAYCVREIFSLIKLIPFFLS